MMATSYSKILARSILISVLLATSAMAQSGLGNSPSQRLEVSIINVPAGNGTFMPAVQILSNNGELYTIQMDQFGLTRATLYDKAALIAWVLARYGQEIETIIAYDDRTGDKDTQNPTPEAPTEKTKEQIKEDDCKTVGGADIKTTDDLPIMLAKFTTSRAYDGGANVWAQPILVTVQPAERFDVCPN